MRAYWGRYELSDTKSQLAAYSNLFTNPPEYIALDTETISLKDTTVLGIGFGTVEYDNFYFSIDDPSLPWHLLKPGPTHKIWHNAPFDLSWHTLGKFGADINNIEDTAILMRLMNLPVVLTDAAAYVRPDTWAVKDLLMQYKAKDMTELPPVIVAEKCCRDVAVTMALFNKFRNRVDGEYYEVERRITSLLLHNSHRGIRLDTNLVDKLDSELGIKAAHHKRTCEILGFNPLSPVKVAKYLTDMGLWLPFNKQNTQPVTDKEALTALDHPIADEILLARKYNTLHNRVKNLVGHDRVYSIYGLDSATGRITSRKEKRPGYWQSHNVPTGSREGDIIPDAGPIRRIIMPDSDVFTRFDMSQVELRILAYFSQDSNMLKELNSASGDIHGRTQKELGIHSRVMAKNFNFGTVYGGDVGVLSIFTGIKDYQLLGYYQQKLANLYPTMWQWLQVQRAEGLRTGRVQTLYGRELILTSHEKNYEKHIMNCAVNWPIQGTAGEIFKRVLLAIIDSGVPIDDLVLQVHDEELIDGRYDHLPLEELSHISPFWTPFDPDPENNGKSRVSHIERWA